MKNNIIKFDQNLCNAKVDDNEILFVRVNDVVNSVDAKLEVPITHNAIVIKGGGDLRYYSSGTYDVFDDRKDAKKWKNGLSVEVIYIPKDTQVLIRWGTPNRLRYRDNASNKVITVGARGEFDVSVSNPEMFYRKVVGAKKEFDLMAFKKRFSETVASEFADMFLRIVEENNLTYDKFTANKKLIGEKLEVILNELFNDHWGLNVLHFKIADFDLLDEDMDAIEDSAAEEKKQQKLREYLSDLERLDDKEWERKKYLRQLELQDKAAYYEVLKVIGNPLPREEIKCPDCNYVCKASDKFCPNCGKKLSKEPIICPKCGHSNSGEAKFCVECGKNL